MLMPWRSWYTRRGRSWSASREPLQVPLREAAWASRTCCLWRSGTESRCSALSRHEWAEASGPSSPPSRRDDCVVIGFGPSDFEVVVPGVAQIGRAAGKELGVDRL